MIYPKHINKPEKTHQFQSNTNRQTTPINTTRVLELIHSKIAQQKKQTDPQENIPFNNPRIYKKSKVINKQNKIQGCNKMVQQLVYSIKIQQDNSLVNSQNQYIKVLQQTQRELKNQLKHMEKQLKSKQQNNNCIQGKQQILKRYFYILELQRFYQQSRKIILACSMELIDYKALMLGFSQKGYFSQNIQPEHIQSVDNLIHKNQVLLKSFNCFQRQGYKLDLQLRQKAQLVSQIKHLKQVNCIQQKIISHMKSANINSNGNEDVKKCNENQKRLLRYQIARIFNENENLKQALKNVNLGNQSSNICIRSHEDGLVMKDYLQNRQQIKNLRQDLIKTKKLFQQLNIDKQQIQQNLYLQKQKNIKLNQQFQLIKLKIGSNFQNTQINQLKQHLKLTQNTLQQTTHNYNRVLQQIINLKGNSLHKKSPEKKNGTISNLGSPISFSHLNLQQRINKFQDFLQLDQNQQYLTIYKDIKHKMDQRIAQIQQMFNKQKKQKQKSLIWCKKVYNLLKKSQISKQDIQKHFQQLHTLQNIGVLTNGVYAALIQLQNIIQNLAQIDQLQVETELRQYIIALKKRSEVIEQVSNEDGSSMQYLQQQYYSQHN